MSQFSEFLKKSYLLSKPYAACDTSVNTAMFDHLSRSVVIS